MYSNIDFSTTIRAQDMKFVKPDVKLFMFVTDPIERLYSHLKMCIRKTWPQCRSGKKPKSISDLIHSITNYTSIEHDSHSIYRDLERDMKSMKRDSFLKAKYVTANPKKGTEKKISRKFGIYIQLGNYISIANDYNQIFGEKYVYMVDGQAILNNPNDEFRRLLQFFQLGKRLVSQ